MATDIKKERIATHSVVNYLNAAFQGRFTFLNILTQLNFPNVPERLFVDTREALERIAIWTEDLWKDTHLFSATWDSPKTPEAQFAINLMEVLKPELFSLSAQITTIVTKEKQDDLIIDLTFLIACYGRYTYARENYVRGFATFYDKFNLPEERARYEKLLADTDTEIKLAHSMLETVQDSSKNTDPAFYRSVVERCLPLIGAFRTHAHDLNQLAAPYRGGISFQTLEFKEDEAKGWHESGFGPVASGYWRSYNFAPKEAVTWAQDGITDPALAFSWRRFGFDPTISSKWLRQGIPPIFAKLWQNAGFTPQEARSYAEKGIYDPAKLPKAENSGPK